MTYWYYAVMTEEGINWSTAQRGRSIVDAKRKLQARFPNAVIFSIER